MNNTNLFLKRLIAEVIKITTTTTTNVYSNKINILFRDLPKIELIYSNVLETYFESGFYNIHTNNGVVRKATK